MRVVTSRYFRVVDTYDFQPGPIEGRFQIFKGRR